MRDFFDTNSYFIDEKVNAFKFENTYKIFDEFGAQIGVIQQKIPFSQKLLRLVLNKGMLPFHFEIKNQNDQVEASITRGWTFFMSKIVIKDKTGEEIGKIQQKFKFFKPTFLINDTMDNRIAEISGDWKAWNFTIKDSTENEIGKISKKWAGAVKEIFTTADKYNVDLNHTISDKKHKAAILSSAITIDMVLKEKK